MRHFILLIIIFYYAFVAYSQNNEPVLTLNTEMHTAGIKRISTDALGKILLTCSSDKTARLWDSETGELLKVFRIPIASNNEGQLYACALSPDGRTAALGGWTGYAWDKSYTIYLFDVATNTLKRKLTGISNLITELEYSPHGEYLAVGLSGGGGVRIFDTYTWIQEKSFIDYEGECYGISFDNAARMVTVCYDGKIRLYNKDFEMIKQAKGESKQIYSVAFSPDGSVLAIGYQDMTRIEVLDGKTLKTLYIADITGVNSTDQQFNAISFTQSGTHLLGGGNYKLQEKSWHRQIRIWSHQGKGSYRDVSAAMNRIMDIKPMPDNSFVYCGASPEFGRFNLDGTERFLDSSETNRYNSNYKSHLNVSNDGTEIGITPYAGKPLHFSVTERQLKVESYEGDIYIDKKDGLYITDWLNTKKPILPKINGADVHFMKYDETNRSVDISSDGQHIVFGADWDIFCTNNTGKLIWTAASPGEAWCTNISGNNKTVVVGMGDGTVRWFDFHTGKMLLSLFMHPDNTRWVLWTPDGHFDCSDGADDLIGWHVN